MLLLLELSLQWNWTSKAPAIIYCLKKIHWINSMSDKDHVRSKNVHFYQVGLGPLNTVTNDGWVIKNLKTIRRFLEHSEVSLS